MKSILTLWLLLFVSHTSLLAQSQTEYTRLTSERIGLNMNQQQRNYFLLFADVEGFNDATFTVHTDNTVGVTIHRSTADTTLTLQTQAARDLAFYTDNFERIYTNEQSYKVDCDLSRIRHLLRPLQRYRFHPDAESASARLLNGGFVEGEIIAATDGVLIFWPAGVPYDWKKASTMARTVHFSEIEVLDVGKEISVRGKKSVFDSFTDYLRPNLSFYSPQRENLPPELVGLLKEIQPVETYTTMDNETVTPFPVVAPTDNIAVRVYNSFPVEQYNSYTHKRVSRDIGARRPAQEENVVFDEPIRSAVTTVKVIYPLSQNWHLGGLLSYSGTPATLANAANTLSMKGASVGLSIDRVIYRYNPESPTAWSNVESDLALSIQGHFYSVFASSKGYYNSYERAYFDDLADQQTQAFISIDLTGMIGYRLWKALNVFAGGSISLFPTITVQEYKQTFYRYGRGYEYGWQGGTGTYLESSIIVGASLFL